MEKLKIPSLNVKQLLDMQDISANEIAEVAHHNTKVRYLSEMLEACELVHWKSLRVASCRIIAEDTKAFNWALEIMEQRGFKTSVISDDYKTVYISW